MKFPSLPRFIRTSIGLVAPLFLRRVDGAAENSQVFSPDEPLIKACEAPFRQGISLNGKWRFQPMPIPAGYERDKGVPPDLELVMLRAG